MASQLFPVTIEDAIIELERELSVRRSIYPTWVRKGRVSQETADHRIDCIESVIRFFKVRNAHSEAA